MVGRFKIFYDRSRAEIGAAYADNEQYVALFADALCGGKYFFVFLPAGADTDIAPAEEIAAPSVAGLYVAVRIGEPLRIFCENILAHALSLFVSEACHFANTSFIFCPGNYILIRADCQSDCSE